VQYCTQLLRESKELKTPVPDPERDGMVDVTQNPQSGPSSDEDPRGANLFNLNYIANFPRQEVVRPLLEKVSREVIPFKLQRLPELLNEEIEREEPMLARCPCKDGIYLLFESPVTDYANCS